MGRKWLEARGSRLEAEHGWRRRPGSDIGPCAHEGDVLDAARTGRWPDRIDDELKAHVAGCAACAEVAAVAPVFSEEWETALDEAQPPSSSLVWWRARRRAREEAARAAGRPVRVAQALAALIVLVAVVVVTWWIREPLAQTAGHIASAMPAWPSTPEAFSGASPLLRGGIALALLAALVLAPVAVYLAVAED